jgi:hypothetical protein
MGKTDEFYSTKEAELRRDKVIHRMASTPPQPKTTTPPHHPKKKKKAVSVRGAGKSRAGRED